MIAGSFMLRLLSREGGSLPSESVYGEWREKFENGSGKISKAFRKKSCSLEEDSEAKYLQTKDSHLNWNLSPKRCKIKRRFHRQMGNYFAGGF